MQEKKKYFVFLAIVIVALSFFLLRNSVSCQENNSSASYQMINIPINPMMELDFKSKSEIYEIRKRYVMQHSNLLNSSYTPSNEVFGQIESGKAWWGIDGLSYKGPGEHGIDGASEETRFICNPFLLVGLEKGVANITDRKPREQYPRPVSLEWSSNKKRARVVYAVKSFWAGNIQNCPKVKNHEFSLIAYNARDLGYKFMFIDLKRSPNISLQTGEAKIIEIPQFIHVGGSCGYKGGCNNMSPFCEDLEIKVKTLPAKVLCKLWRKKPSNQNSTADMEFEVMMK